MFARTDLNLGSALVCLLIGSVLLAIVWVIDRRQLRRHEAEAVARPAGPSTRSAAPSSRTPLVEAQDLVRTGDSPTRAARMRPATGSPGRISVDPLPAARSEEPETAPRPEVEEAVAFSDRAPATDPDDARYADEAEVRPARPAAPVTFTAHAQGAPGVRFADPAAIIDLTAPPTPSVVEPAPTPSVAEPEPAPSAPVAAADPAPFADPVRPTPAARPAESAHRPESVRSAPPATSTHLADPSPTPSGPAGDDRVRRRRGRRARVDVPPAPKLPKGAEAALAAMVEVMPDPRNTVKTTRDPTAEVLLTRAERRAIDEARAYRPPEPDRTEWETPIEARVEAMTPFDDPNPARVDI